MAHLHHFGCVSYLRGLMRHNSNPESRTDERARGVLDRSHTEKFAINDLPDSGISDFGDSGGRGFAEGWDEAAANEDPALIAASAQFGAEDEVISQRNLDKRSKRGVVLLLLLVLIGGGLAYAIQQGLIFGETSDEADTQDALELLAPEAPRDFEDGPLSVRLGSSATASSFFLSSLGAEPEPLEEPVAGLPDEVSAGPVFWAGRLHIAMFATGIGSNLTDEHCAVAALVQADLVPVDVAGAGTCPAFLSDSTGDRLACRGDDLVMIEVWTDDPSTSSVPPPVELVRVRIEQAREDGRIDSVRAQFDVPPFANGDPLIAVASSIGGAPGDVISLTTSTGSTQATCELLDRSDVAVRLLPS